MVTDIADQIDGQLDDHIKELKEQSRVECELMKRELERTYQETVRTMILSIPFQFPVVSVKDVVGLPHLCHYVCFLGFV